MQSLDRQTEVTILEQNRRLVVRILASLTIGNAAAIRTVVLSEWDESGELEEVILDLGHVQHMDSSGVGVLLELAHRAEKAGIPLRLCCLQESPRRLFDRTGLGGLFPIYGTLEDVMFHLPVP